MIVTNSNQHWGGKEGGWERGKQTGWQTDRQRKTKNKDLPKRQRFKCQILWGKINWKILKDQKMVKNINSN